MKLYLTEILKEANELGFGAPGQGGNSADVSMQGTMPGMKAPPLMQPNQQMGGMMLPPSQPGLGMGMGQPGLQLPPNQPFKSTI